MQPSYLGLLLAGVCLLGAAAAAVGARRLPRELLLLAMIAAALCLGAGFVIEARWELRGALVADLSPDEAANASRLLVTPVYLDALGVDPGAAGTLRQGIVISREGETASVAYQFSGIGRGPAYTAASTWAARTPREAAGIALAARLQCARSYEDIARVLGGALPVLGRPSLLLLRQMLPEWRDRFPAARAMLDDFGRKIGGGRER